MSLVRQIRHGLRALVRRGDADRDVRDEVQHYLDEAAAAHIARGMTRDAAVRAARLEIGSAAAVHDEVRAAGWEHIVETALADAGYALRRLSRSPTFTATAIATLALGIGASTAVFSAVNPILVEPLPFPHADRVVTLDDRTDQGVPMDATLGTYDEVRARSRSFEALAAADRWRPSLVGIGAPEQLDGQRVTSSYLDVFGAVPLAGRAITAADDEPGGPNLVVISERLLDRRFGGDRSIVGRAIELDGDPYTVIGIMPRAFENVVLPSADLWSPLRERSTGDLRSRAWGHHYQIVGRLAATTTIVGATAEILAIGRSPVSMFPRPPWADLKRGLLIQSVQDEVTRPVKPALFAILGGVLLLLAIAAVNVTSLLLARGVQQRTEFAVRIALGAGGRRLIRQVLTESLALAACGGALGLLLAQAGVHAFVAWSPPGLPRVGAIRVDARVFAFAALLTTVVGVVVGAVPAVAATRPDAARGLRHGGHRATRRAAARGGLVIAEIALTLVLLVSAGLLFRSVRRLVAVAPGFDPSHVITMQVVEAGHGFDSGTARLAFFQQALDAVRSVPGVTSAAFTSQLPLSGDVDGYGYEWQAIPSTKAGESGSALRYAVTPDYFAAMRIPLRRGRLITPVDRPGAPEAVLINESLARRLFGDRDPIGERVRFGPEMAGAHPWDYVIGVVGDVKQYTLAVAAPDAFYVANGQWGWVDGVQSLVVRTQGDAAALVPTLERAVWSVNAHVPIRRVETMDGLVAASAGQRRFALAAIETFALAALVLATIGLYGVIAGSVTERIREIGIRAALGATPGEIVRGVVGDGVVLALAGSALGCAGALIASRFLQTMLFSVSRLDPVTYAGVIVLLIAMAVVAAWAPARRAAGVDPTIALRAD